MPRPRASGFTLIELLIVVAVIGIVAAIAIPSLLNAIDRGRQKRTMADLRTVATAIEMYEVDRSHVPNANTVALLATVLEPVYIGTLPQMDGWGGELIYSGSATGYTVGSASKDGGSSLAVNGGGGPQHEITADIIWVNGHFLQWPEGAQE